MNPSVLFTSRCRSMLSLGTSFFVIESRSWRCVCGCFVRSLCTSQETKKATAMRRREPRKLKVKTGPPESTTVDWIGPPDPASNIRPIRFYIPEYETATEKEFRLQQAEMLEWNQKFWSQHNLKFFKEKGEFVQKHKKDDSKKKASLSPEEMSVFYKKFLDDHREDHLNYNKEWYKKNIYLLWPAVKVFVIRLQRKLGLKI